MWKYISKVHFTKHVCLLRLLAWRMHCPDFCGAGDLGLLMDILLVIVSFAVMLGILGVGCHTGSVDAASCRSSWALTLPGAFVF